MNKAMLGKVGWRLLHDRNSLWARILRAKYKVGDVRNDAWLTVKSNCSATWRSVVLGLCEVVLPGIRWNLGDGKDIRVWTDKWLISTPLSEMAVGVLPENYENLRVRDVWQQGVGWDPIHFLPYVSAHTRLLLRAVVLDNVTGAMDRLAWGESLDGQFSVKSAYALATRNNTPRQDLAKLFDRVWKVKVTERVRCFLWLVVHQVIMTNSERLRRHMSDTSVCSVCNGGIETIIHVLRDCPAMSGVWERLVHQGRHHQFFRSSLLEWIYGNLRDHKDQEDGSWPTLFAVGVWWAWKWRCGDIFGGLSQCRDRVRFLKDMAREMFEANVVSWGSGGKPRRQARQIGWSKPSEGWVKLNTDGASHGNPGMATAGGALRDGDGTWISGFALNIGICSAPLAELWGVYYGLCIAWEKRYTRVELEVDSEIVVGFLTTGISDLHPLSFLVRLCYGFISRDWLVRVRHVYREANRLADGLANYAFTLPLGFHALNVCPECVQVFVFEDAMGVSRPRAVPLL